MRILGIDPGIATVGFGVIDSERGKHGFVRCGVITTPAGTPLTSRLDRIYSDLTELIGLFRPDAAAVEQLFFNTNITTGISVAEGRGVILLACYRAGVPVYEYTPLQVKQAVTGYGAALKPQVMEMTRRLLCLREVPKPDDTADALAMAICHGQAAGSPLRRAMLNGGR